MSEKNFASGRSSLNGGLKSANVAPVSVPQE